MRHGAKWIIAIPLFIYHQQTDFSSLKLFHLKSIIEISKFLYKFFSPELQKYFQRSTF